jgi:hypothetical protein
MSSLARIKWHLVLLAGAALLTASSRVAFKDRHADELRRLNSRGASQRAREIEAMWAALSYTDATAPDFVDRFLAKIDWNRIPVSDAQRTKLQARVRDVVGYLQAPTFDEYFRLRTEGLHYVFLPTLTNVAQATAGSQAVELEDGAEQAARKIWNSAHSRNGQVDPSRINSVCLDRIAASISYTNSLGDLLNGGAAKGFTMAAVMPNPGFSYPGDGSKLSQASPILNLSFFAKAGASTNAGPVYISLCWLANDEQWALNRMVADSWVALRTVF